jgi:hypothetical protein
MQFKSRFTFFQFADDLLNLAEQFSLSAPEIGKSIGPCPCAGKDFA